MTAKYPKLPFIFVNFINLFWNFLLIIILSILVNSIQKIFQLTQPRLRKQHSKNPSFFSQFYFFLYFT